MRAFALLALALFAAAPATAGNIVSRDASDVSVTVYRDPQRGEGAMNAYWPGGYALISETRTVHIPAGESVIRFEGVAEGMLPETAIVSGLPRGVREKNRDARLISPAGLVDAYLKRRVMLRRTNPATGKVVEQEAIIQAGPTGGVVLRTAEGIEALGCSGLPERMLYDGVPDDLSAKPTLSVLTSSDREVTVTVQLTYLAQGFDWSANYVGTMDDDGRTMALFAWLTLANGGAQSFAEANLQVVAGQPNRERTAPQPRGPAPELRLRCWPMGNTSTIIGPPPPPPPPPAPMMMDGESDIVVTAMRRAAPMSAPIAMKAVQEDLGDLKLYRVPERVTVAAQSQKQVAMIEQPEARFDRVYVADVSGGSEEPQGMGIQLRSRNVKEKGLGLPLPAGGIALFEPAGGRPMLAGEDDMADRAIGEDVEINVGQSPDVTWTLTRVSEEKGRQRWRIALTNARPVPVKAEIVIPFEMDDKPKGLVRGKGGWLLKAEVPANGKADLYYTVRLERRGGR